MGFIKIEVFTEDELCPIATFAQIYGQIIHKSNMGTSKLIHTGR